MIKIISIFKVSLSVKKGFTLVEVLIAIGIFSIVAVIASGIVLDSVQLEKKTAIQNALYEDLRIAMQQIETAIKNGTIDYEEYYSMNVVQAGESEKFYGLNNGAYASRFFDPGESLDGLATTNPHDLGVECSYESLPGVCEIYFTDSSDSATGQNPYNATDAGSQARSDAFCDNETGSCNPEKNVVSELYLINSTGTEKTIIGRKIFKENIIEGADYVLGIMKMHGYDLDQNGIIDVFGCSEEFHCYGEGEPSNVDPKIKYPFVDENVISQNEITLPEADDLNTAFDIATTEFLPISPMRTSIKDLKFVINPVEDPYRAYYEKDPSTGQQTHPSVKIIMTVGLSAAAAKEYPGDFPDVTVETTVSAGLSGFIDSYPPIDDVKVSGAASWLEGVTP